MWNSYEIKLCSKLCKEILLILLEEKKKLFPQSSVLKTMYIKFSDIFLDKPN